MEPETLEHILLDCKVLAETCEPYISELDVLIKECHSCVKCNTTNGVKPVIQPIRAKNSLLKQWEKMMWKHIFIEFWGKL